MPVAQSGLTPETVARLLAAHRPGRVTAAAYRDLEGKLRRGHPLLIDAGLRAAAAEREERLGPEPQPCPGAGGEQHRRR